MSPAGILSEFIIKKFHDMIIILLRDFELLLFVDFVVDLENVSVNGDTLLAIK